MDISYIGNCVILSVVYKFDDLLCCANAVSGDGSNIDIPAVFISREAGYILSEFVDDKDARLYLLPALETSAWSILAISSISLLTVSAVLSTFFLLRRQQLRRVTIRILQEPTGLSNDEIKALSTSTYNQKDVASPETCTICLEEFTDGEMLRIFQCNHGKDVFTYSCQHTFLHIYIHLHIHTLYILGLKCHLVIVEG